MTAFKLAGPLAIIVLYDNGSATGTPGQQFSSYGNPSRVTPFDRVLDLVCSLGRTI